ncbi:hypothetical protein LOZ58_005018 [Ophidiomyces ophidiicola]|nr:hypothetical protein LOZ58_005018 [Ophidiomyces ophidiicola]
MQTPSQIVPLELHHAHDELQQQREAADARPGAGIARVDSIQRIVRFDLKEEGNHVLAVSISYTETLTTAAAVAAMTTTTGVDVPGSGSGVQASGGRARTFRKLYQFVAQPCLNVRTKATELAAREVDNRSLGPYGKSKLQRFVLEAQLENVGDEIITLGAITLNAKAPFGAQSLNWDVEPRATGSSANNSSRAPTLSPRDVLQIAFLVEQEGGEAAGAEGSAAATTTTAAVAREGGRTTLGQLSLEWRSALGERGFLTTGNLMTKKR